MAKQKISYTEALAELESILNELDKNNELKMDDISEKVKRAAILIEMCKKQLHELDEEFEKIIDNLA